MFLESPSIGRKIGKPNNLRIFGNNKTKGPKQDSQYQLRSSMSEGGEQ